MTPMVALSKRSKLALFSRSVSKIVNLGRFAGYRCSLTSPGASSCVERARMAFFVFANVNETWYAGKNRKPKQRRGEVLDSVNRAHRAGFLTCELVERSLGRGAVFRPSASCCGRDRHSQTRILMPRRCTFP